jgi:hypothetical protein
MPPRNLDANTSCSPGTIQLECNVDMAREHVDVLPWVINEALTMPRKVGWDETSLPTA